MNRGINGQRGATLVYVVALMGILSIIGGVFLRHQMMDSEGRSRKNHHFQAMYLAESGVIYALKARKSRLQDHPSDTLSKDTSENLNPTEGNEEEKANTQEGFNPPSFAFYLNPTLLFPDVTVSEENGNLSLVSKSTYMGVSATLEIEAGKQYIADWARAGLVLTGETELEFLSYKKITGPVFVKTLHTQNPANQFALPESFMLMPELDKFSASLQEKYREMLATRLAEDRTLEKTAYFTPDKAPQFSKNTHWSFPMDGILLENSGNTCWTLTGPGTLSTVEDIRLKGCIQLLDITLLAGGNVVFEDSVSSINLVVYTEKNMEILGNSSLDIQAHVMGELVLDRTSKTSYTSLLHVFGKQGSVDTTGENSPSGIIVRGKAKAKGLLLSLDNKGFILLEERESRAEGILVARDFGRFKGQIQGLVITSRLECVGDITVNCLGEGMLEAGIPGPVVWPEALDIEAPWEYKLTRWKWTRGEDE